MVRKIAVRRSAQVRQTICSGQIWTAKYEQPLTDGPIMLQVLYNNKGYHSMPTYLNVLNNAILRANLPVSKGNPAAYGSVVR